MTPDSVIAVTQAGVYDVEITLGEEGKPRPPVPPETVELRGISNGIDNRDRKDPPQQKPGRLTSAAAICSGALIGQRVVRTAAHCVIAHNTDGGSFSANSSVHFEYQRNGVNSVNVIGTASTYWIGGNYISQGCGIAHDINADGDLLDAGEYVWGYNANLANCANEDWALILLPDLWWSGHSIAAFGYRMPATGDVGQSMIFGGYPQCGVPGAPANCRDQSFYRDSSTSCMINFYDSTSPDLRRFSSGCDTSVGQSGGPFWERSSNLYLGHAQYDDCDVGCGGSPNHFLGHNAWLFDFENTVRANSGRP